MPASATGLFNSAVAAFAVATAWETGLLDELHASGRLRVTTFSVANDLHTPSMEAVCTALAASEIVTREGGEVLPGPLFDETRAHQAFFHWLTIGCGPLFSQMPRVVHNSTRTYNRDAAAIAFACREINVQCFDPVFFQALDSLDFTPAAVADLGCGSGGRLLHLASRYPSASGVGVDIAADALQEAEKLLHNEGVAERCQFVTADVRALLPDNRFADVELLTCFMMGHDFWPRDECIAALRQLRTAFPKARRLLLGDTARAEGIVDTETPVFTLAYETAHALMGVSLPTQSDWAGVFEPGGWRCVGTREVSTPTASVVYELEPLY